MGKVRHVQAAVSFILHAGHEPTQVGQNKYALVQTAGFLVIAKMHGNSTSQCSDKAIR